MGRKVFHAPHCQQMAREPGEFEDAFHASGGRCASSMLAGLQRSCEREDRLVPGVSLQVGGQEAGKDAPQIYCQMVE
jgi:hypothetical protein